MSVDRISDFLTILRNGTAIAKRSVSAPHSNMSESIARVLKNEGFIKDYTVADGDAPGKRMLTVSLKYVDGESVIHEIARVSTPGRRRYSKLKNVKPVVGGLGISILSTNAGVVTDKQAKQLSVGGEILCTVW